MEKKLIIKKIDDLMLEKSYFVVISMNIYETNNKIIISSPALNNITKEELADELSIDFLHLCYYIVNKMMDSDDKKEWFFKKLFIDINKSKVENFFNKDKYCAFVISEKYKGKFIEFLQSQNTTGNTLSFMQELLKAIINLRKKNEEELLVKICRAVEKVTGVKILKESFR